MQLVHQIMAFSDSDDELLEPTFLQKKTINQVLTSSKAVYQDELTLSPQTLTPPSCVSKKKKSHFSLMGLLAEKNNLCVKSETDEKIDEMRKKFEEGDFTRLVEETDNIESETIHHSQETSLENQTQNLNEHDKQLLKKVTSFLENDFPDTFPGEEVFVHEVKEELIQDMTPFFSCFDEDLDGVNDEVIKIALLTFIIDESTSDDVCQLLWRLICLHKDDVVSKLAYDVLLDSIENKRKSWFPKAADFFGFLVNLGADAIKLVPSSVSLNKFCTIPMQPEELEFTETSSIRERFFARCSNLILLLRLYTFCIQKKLVTLCADEIDCLVLVALRLCLDKVVQLAVWDLEVLIGSLLDSYNQWDKDQMVKLSKDISAMNLQHHNILQLSCYIPLTLRGLQFKQVFSFEMATNILQKSRNSNYFPITPRSILEVIYQLHINEETDYYRLHSAILLLDTCLYTDDVLASQKGNLTNLMNKLRSLNGEIKECRGHFMDRTKVKDVIVRFASKIMFALQNLQTQCHLDSYFEKNSSNIIQIESLKQTDDGTDEISD